MGGFVLQAAGMLVADNLTPSLPVLVNSYRKTAGIVVGFLVTQLMGLRTRTLLESTIKA